MKPNWFVISTISSLISGFVTFFLCDNYKIAILITSIIFIVLIINNPRWRYMRIAINIISVTLILNRFFFQFTGNVLGFKIEMASNGMSDVLSLSLVGIAILCLVLDYLEGKGKLSGTLFQINKNIVKNVKGKKVKIYQNIDKD